MGKHEGPYVAVKLAALESTAAIFAKIERVMQLELEKLKLTQELAPSTVHQKLIEANADAQDATCLEFTPEALARFRRCFRVVVDQEWADKLQGPVGGTMRLRVQSAYGLEIDNDSFTCILPLRRGDVPITVTTATARALISYLVPRLFTPDPRPQWWVAFEKRNDINGWERVQASGPIAQGEPANEEAEAEGL